MPKRPLTDKDGEVRELTAADLKKFRPAARVDPGMVEAARALRGRPRSASPKRGLYVRLDPDIVDWLKSAGAGYQTRMNAILRAAKAKDVERK